MNERTVKTLQDYRDKSYVSNIMCELSCEFYTLIRQIINIPLILSSSVMTIINSWTFDENDLKISNIILNASTALLLSLSGNFRISEKIGSFRALGLKYNKLCHLIEDHLANSIDVIDCKDMTRQIIAEYDALNESLEFTYPSHIKTKCKRKFYGKRCLPNILNCEIDFTDSANSANSPVNRRISVSLVNVV